MSKKKAKQNPIPLIGNTLRSLVPPVVGGATGYLAGPAFGLDKNAQLATTLLGVAVGIGIGGYIDDRKQDNWCSDFWWWPTCWFRSSSSSSEDSTSESLTAAAQMYQPTAEQRANLDKAAAEEYGFLTAYSTRSNPYLCLWKGAQDALTKDDVTGQNRDSVSTLINLLHDNKFPPASYPKKLEDSWFSQTPLNAKFDDSVDAAVRAFQRSVGLEDDGVVGPNTWKALGVFGFRCYDCPADAKTVSQKDWTPAVVPGGPSVWQDWNAGPGRKPKKHVSPIPWWVWALAGTGMTTVAGMAFYKALKKKRAKKKAKKLA